MQKLITSNLLLIFCLVGCVTTKQKQLYIAPTIDNQTKLDKKSLLSQLKFLSSDELAGRKIATEGSKAAQLFLIKQLKEYNVEPFAGNYQHSFQFDRTFTRYQGTNIIGYIESNQPSDSYIVLSAHYDHIGTIGTKIFNGTDDNASGTAALLSIAGQLKHQNLKHNIIILFTDGEEIALLGAKAFTKDFSSLLNNIKMNINLDMLAGSENTKRLHYISYGLDRVLSEAKEEAFKTQHKYYPLKIKKGFKARSAYTSFTVHSRKQWRLASDHGVFYQQGIPFIYYGVGEHINYHQESDTYQNVNKDFFVKASQAIYQQILLLDKLL